MIIPNKRGSTTLQITNQNWYTKIVHLFIDVFVVLFFYVYTRGIKVVPYIPPVYTLREGWGAVFDTIVERYLG